MSRDSLCLRGAKLSQRAIEPALERTTSKRKRPSKSRRTSMRIGQDALVPGIRLHVSTSACLEQQLHVAAERKIFLNEVWQAWVVKVSLLTAVSTMPILDQGVDPNWLVEFSVSGVT